MFRKILDRGEAGDNVGILLRGIEKTDIKRGMVLCKTGSVTPHAKFKAEVYILKKEEGGRHTPFHNNYRPQFYVRTTDVTGNISLPDGVEMVMPGDNLTIHVDLIQPVALSTGLRFAIREGGRTVGAGQVSRVDSVDIALGKLNGNLDGAVLLSDAFFPFRDSIDKIARAGIKTIVQPGGSVKDSEVIDACNEFGIAMLFTGSRCFRH